MTKYKWDRKVDPRGLTEAILMIWKKTVRSETFDEVGGEQSFKNFINNRSKNNMS